MDDWVLFPVKDEQIEIRDRKCKTSLKNTFAQQMHENRLRPSEICFKQGKATNPFSPDHCHMTGLVCRG